MKLFKRRYPGGKIADTFYFRFVDVDGRQKIHNTGSKSKSEADRIMKTFLAEINVQKTVLRQMKKRSQRAEALKAEFLSLLEAPGLQFIRGLFPDVGASEASLAETRANLVLAIEDSEAELKAKLKDLAELKNPKIESILGHIEAWESRKLKSAKTLTHYRDRFNDFVNWLRKSEKKKVIRYKDITLADLEKFKKHCETIRGIKKETINGYLLKIMGLFHTLLKEEVVESVPPIKKLCYNPRETRFESKEPIYLTKEEVPDYLAKLKALKNAERSYVISMLGIYAGLRRSEIGNILWEEVDFDRKVIKVRKHDDDPARGIEEWEPKTKRGIREIPMHTDLMCYLKELRKQHPGQVYVLNSNSGRPEKRMQIDTSSFRRNMQKLGV